jgi:hypothetical protein|tara:strand:+ start:583 stop:1461 length:879 start_codon:yes stop_codon:yes gene_type:complete
MSDMALFEEGNSLISKDLFKELTAVDDLLSGGTSVSTIPPRISIKGAKFREMVSGEQTQVRKDDFLNVVIVNAGALSRTYYEGEYDSDNPTPPACWSPDNKKPDAEVENPQAKTCESCPQNVKGSGKGESRACRFNQRIAVLLEGDLDTVYQLQLPATSIFGKDKKGMGMQQYVAFLKSKGAPSIGVITKMYFDEDSAVPKLFFKPERPLKEEELKQALEARESPQALNAITMTVSKVDAVEKKREVKVQETEDVVDVEDTVEEPKKVSKKADGAAPPPDEDLASIVEEWDD